MNAFAGLVDHLSRTPLLAICLTLAAYEIATRVYQWLHRPVWLPPIVGGCLLLVPAIHWLPLDYPSYKEGATWISFLLGPATVALAIPLYLEFHHLRAALKPILITLAVGVVTAPALTLGIAWLLGAEEAILLSLAPKSVTAPIAVSLAESLGGFVGLTVGVVALTGVLASLATPLLWRHLDGRDHRALGFVMGLNGHGIATARAFEISPQTGAFASLGMGLTGTLTAVLLPWFLST